MNAKAPATKFIEENWTSYMYILQCDGPFNAIQHLLDMEKYGQVTPAEIWWWVGAGQMCRYTAICEKLAALRRDDPWVPDLPQDPVWCECGDSIVRDSGALCGHCAWQRCVRPVPAEESDV